MSEAQLSSYEEIPYDSKPLYPTHPDCLATVATLMGMKPAPVERCRVLELGCATGGNLIPMAQALPGSTFVGIDLSTRQIADGAEDVGGPGAENIELRARAFSTWTTRSGSSITSLATASTRGCRPPSRTRSSIFAAATSPNGRRLHQLQHLPGWHCAGGCAR